MDHKSALLWQAFTERFQGEGEPDPGEAPRKLVAAVVTGEPAELEEQAICAEWIVWLCTASEAEENGREKGRFRHPRGLAVRNAIVKGEMVACGLTIARPLAMTNCTFKDDVRLSWAKTQGLDFTGSTFEGSLLAEGISVAGSVLLRGAKCLAGLNFRVGNISGDLECGGAEFKCDSSAESAGRDDRRLRRRSFIGTQLKVGGSIFFNRADGHLGGCSGEPFKAVGEIRLRNAEIGGMLEVTGALLRAQHEDAIPVSDPIRGRFAHALSAAGIKVGSHVYLNHGFMAEGGVRLRGARIGGNLEAQGGLFIRPRWEGKKGNTGCEDFLSEIGTRLSEIHEAWLAEKVCTDAEAENVVAAGGLGKGLDDLRTKLSTRADEMWGLDRREGTDDSGQTNLRNCFVAHQIQVGGRIRMDSGFVAIGEVRLRSARIGVRLDAGNGLFFNPLGTALEGNLIETADSINLFGNFQAWGGVSLRRGKIGGKLNGHKGGFFNPTGDALIADELQVNGAILLREVTVKGSMHLHRARTGDDFDCSGAKFHLEEEWLAIRLERAQKSPGSIDWNQMRYRQLSSLSAAGIQVGGNVVFSDAEFEGAVRLRDARINSALLCDGTEFNALGQYGSAIHRRLGEVFVRGDVAPRWPKALLLHRAEIKGSVYFENGFQAWGGILMEMAVVGGDVVFSRGILFNPAENAFEGRLLSVGGILRFGRRAPLTEDLRGETEEQRHKNKVNWEPFFFAYGKTDLFRVQVGESLSAICAVFDDSCPSGLDSHSRKPEERTAIMANGAEVKGTLYFREGFKAFGAVELDHANIGGLADFRNGIFRGRRDTQVDKGEVPGGASGTDSELARWRWLAISMTGIRVGGAFRIGRGYGVGRDEEIPTCNGLVRMRQASLVV